MLQLLTDHFNLVLNYFRPSFLDDPLYLIIILPLYQLLPYPLPLLLVVFYCYQQVDFAGK